MNAIRSLTTYNFKLLFRDRSSVILSFLMPIGFYVLFGYMLSSVEVQGTSLSDLLIPLYIIIIIGNAVINVFGAFYVSAKESGNLQKYKFLGVSELRFALSLFMATLFFQIIVIGAFVLFAYVYKGIVFPWDNIFSIALTLFVVEIFHFSITFFLTSLLKKASLYNPIALSFYMFQMFLGGLTFPLEMFPQLLQKLVYWINPIIYGRDALLAAWTGNGSMGAIVKDNMILLTFSIALVALGIGINRYRFLHKTSLAR